VVIPYEASYMGISLLDMTLTWEDRDSTIHIRYDNRLKPFVDRFHHLHNIYEVEFIKGSFEPLSWSKQVSEGDMNFNLGASRGSGDQVNFSNGLTSSFPKGGFTVFSATHFLAAQAHDPGFFPTELSVFIDGETWVAKATRYTADAPHPTMEVSGSQVLIQTDLSYLEGSRVMQENDILMGVIATEGTRFLLWVEPDGTYGRAQFGQFPKAVVMERQTP